MCELNLDMPFPDFTLHSFYMVINIPFFTSAILKGFMNQQMNEDGGKCQIYASRSLRKIMITIIIA